MKRCSNNLKKKDNQFPWSTLYTHSHLMRLRLDRLPKKSSWAAFVTTTCISSEMKYFATSSPGLFPQKIGGAGKEKISEDPLMTSKIPVPWLDATFYAPPIFWGKSPGDEVEYFEYFDAYCNLRGLRSCFIEYFYFTWYKVGLWKEWILGARVGVSTSNGRIMSPVIQP